jgi:hypothetical protein
VGESCPGLMHVMFQRQTASWRRDPNGLLQETWGDFSPMSRLVKPGSRAQGNGALSRGHKQSEAKGVRFSNGGRSPRGTPNSSSSVVEAMKSSPASSGRLLSSPTVAQGCPQPLGVLGGSPVPPRVVTNALHERPYPFIPALPKKSDVGGADLAQPHNLLCCSSVFAVGNRSHKEFLSKALSFPRRGKKSSEKQKKSCEFKQPPVIYIRIHKRRKGGTPKSSQGVVEAAKGVASAPRPAADLERAARQTYSPTRSPHERTYPWTI